MVRKALLAFIVVLVLLGGFLLVQLLLGGGETEPAGNNSNVKKKTAEEKVWDGKSEHLYNMQFPDSEGGSLVLERVAFSGLRSPRASAVARFEYLGRSLPDWLSPGSIKKNFNAFYQGSDDKVVFVLAAGPLEDGRAVIDMSFKNVPSVRLDRNSPKGLFVLIQGLLPRDNPLSVRIVATPPPGYMLGSR